MQATGATYSLSHLIASSPHSLQEMRDELKALGLSTKGLKPELTQRLQEAIEAGGSAGVQGVTPASAPDGGAAPEAPQVTHFSF